MISVVIPNYNGVTLLENNIPLLIESLEYSGESNEIIVVDDYSSDTSKEFLQEHYPDMRVISNDRNYGFARTCNAGIAAARGEFTCVVNSDVQFKKEYFKNALALLRASKAFATLGDIHNYIDGNWDVHRTAGMLEFRRGLIRFKTAPDLDQSRFGWKSRQPVCLRFQARLTEHL